MQIFVQDVTLLDCALLLPHRGPKGMSWSVDVIWEGEKNAVGVVFDFALAKKIAKQIVDHEFDHKLIVQESQVVSQTHARVILYSESQNNGTAIPFAINTYSQSVKKVAGRILLSLEEGELSLLEDEISKAILRQSPENVQKVRVKLKEQPLQNQDNIFNYTHSLCEHYGNCQRFHGHSSRVEIYRGGKICFDLSKKISNKLDGCSILSRDYIDQNWSSKRVQELLEYCPELEEQKSVLTALSYSGGQGDVALILASAKILLLPSESTIENLTEYIRALLVSEKDIEVHCYEGVSKGAICS